MGMLLRDMILATFPTIWRIHNLVSYFILQTEALSIFSDCRL